MSVAESNRPLGTVAPSMGHLSILPSSPSAVTTISPSANPTSLGSQSAPVPARSFPTISPMNINNNNSNNSPIVSYRNRSSMHKAPLSTPQDMIRSFRMQHTHHHKTNSQPAPANSFTEGTNPLANIPIEVSRSGQNVRITALAPQALPEKFSPLPGVQHQPSLSTTLEATNDKTGTASTTANVSSLRKAQRARSDWSSSLRKCFSGDRVPLDTYVRCTLLPGGVGQLTEVVYDSGINVHWKRPQKLMLHYDAPAIEAIHRMNSYRQQKSIADGSPAAPAEKHDPVVASTVPGGAANRVVVVSDVASISSKATREPNLNSFLLNQPPSPSITKRNETPQQHQHQLSAPQGNNHHNSKTLFSPASTSRMEEDATLIVREYDTDEVEMSIPPTPAIGAHPLAANASGNRQNLPISRPLSFSPTQQSGHLASSPPPPPPSSPPFVPAPNGQPHRGSFNSAITAALNMQQLDDCMGPAISNSHISTTSTTIAPLSSSFATASGAHVQVHLGGKGTPSPRSLAMNAPEKTNTTKEETIADVEKDGQRSPTPTAFSGPLLLLEVICCSPHRTDEGPSVDEDRLVASGTYELKGVMDTPRLLLANQTVQLKAVETESLGEKGTINFNIEFFPDKLFAQKLFTPMENLNETDSNGEAVMQATSSFSVGVSGTFHIEVLSALDLTDPFSQNRHVDHDWALMRNMFMAVFLYLAAGVGFYIRYEEWSFLDAVYFCLVTATTTGFGDLRPSSDESRIFTMFFVLVGIGMIAIAVGIAGGLMLERQEQELYKKLVAEKEKRMMGLNPDEDQKQPWLGRTTKRLLVSFFLFNSILWGGAIGFYYLEDNISFLSSVYLCVITMSTVGYGDVTPKTKAGRAFCCPWMVVSVLVVTRIIGEVTDIYMTWQRERRAQAVLKNSIQTVEDLAALDDDNSGQVSELEFLKHMLVKTNACTQREVDTICEQFRALDVDGSGFLDADDFKKMADEKATRRLPNAAAVATGGW